MERLQPSYEEDLADLRGIAHEALSRTDDLERLLQAVRDDEPLAEVAPEGGELVSRYFAMRRELLQVHAPALQPYVGALGEVLNYLGQLLYYAPDLLAVSWRSELLREQQSMVGTIGPQGERLRRIVCELDEFAEQGPARG